MLQLAVGKCGGGGGGCGGGGGDGGGGGGGCGDGGGGKSMDVCDVFKVTKHGGL